MAQPAFANRHLDTLCAGIAVAALHHHPVLSGVDPDVQPLCPPMRGFAEMSFWYALDIVQYLRSLPAGSFEVPDSDCGLVPGDAPEAEGGRCWPQGERQ